MCLPVFWVSRRPRAFWKPQNDVPVDAEAAEKVLKFMDALDDLDDVQNVYANFDIADEVMEKLSS